jgi:mycothiol synthase
MTSGHPTLMRSPECERHALRRTRRLHWRGTDVPAYVPACLAGFTGLRGDEAVTEQMAVAVERRDERVLVVEHQDLEGDRRSVAVVVEDARFGERQWTVETVAPPNDARSHHRLLDSVLELPGCPATVMWRPPSLGMSRFPVPTGSTIERTILELRGPVPPRAAPPRHVRLLDAGAAHDVAARILEVNNSAFGAHPEQGALSHRELDDRMRAPWFDPSLLLLAVDERRGSDAGFVWMKCAPGRPVELYVVAVHPGAELRGLGRYLVSEGFATAAERGAGDVGMLHVDAANDRAVGLYRSLGFSPVRRQDVVRIPKDAA